AAAQRFASSIRLAKRRLCVLRAFTQPVPAPARKIAAQAAAMIGLLKRSGNMGVGRWRLHLTPPPVTAQPRRNNRQLWAEKKRRERTRGVFEKTDSGLGNVARNELCHLEHRDLRFATEHDLQRGIRVDLRADLGVLQLVFLDIGPELLGELSAWKGGRAHDSRESGIGRDGFHERCVWFSFSHSDCGFRALSLESKALLEGKVGFCLGESSTFSLACAVTRARPPAQIAGRAPRNARRARAIPRACRARRCVLDRARARDSRGGWCSAGGPQRSSCGRATT